MNTLRKASAIISFVCCLLGGVILLIHGIDQKDYWFCGFGLFCIGIAFFVGPMLGTRPDDE